MKIAILLGAVAIGLSFSIGLFARPYGPEVMARFLEKGGSYDAESLRKWIREEPKAARGYVFPVLFPLDLLFLAVLGGFLAFGSLSVMGSLGVSSRWSWLLVILPIVYVTTDLGEDVLLGRMLTSSESITDELVTFTQDLTRIKIVACTLGVLQTVTVATVSLYRGD